MSPSIQSGYEQYLMSKKATPTIPQESAIAQNIENKLQNTNPSESNA